MPINEISKAEKKIGGFALMIAGTFMCFGILFGSYINPISATDIDGLTVISGHLIKEPEVDKSTLRSPSTNVIFELEEYPSMRLKLAVQVMRLLTWTTYRNTKRVTTRLANF